MPLQEELILTIRAVNLANAELRGVMVEVKALQAAMDRFGTAAGKITFDAAPLVTYGEAAAAAAIKVDALAVAEERLAAAWAGAGGSATFAGRGASAGAVAAAAGSSAGLGAGGAIRGASAGGVL